MKELRKYKSLYEDKNGTNDRLKTDLENQRKLTEKYKVQLKDLKEKNSKFPLIYDFLNINNIFKWRKKRKNE